jgi:hypothetical protein
MSGCICYRTHKRAMMWTIMTRIRCLDMTWLTLTAMGHAVLVRLLPLPTIPSAPLVSLMAQVLVVSVSCQLSHIPVYLRASTNVGLCSWCFVLCALQAVPLVFLFYLFSLPLSSYNMNESILRPPLWSSGQSSWLQMRRPRFDSRHYQKKSSGSGTGSAQPREYNWGATW